MTKDNIAELMERFNDAYCVLTAMKTDHPEKTWPTSFVYPDEVRNAAETMRDALTTLSARVETLEAQQLSVLTGFYLKQPVAVAEICDTVLDRSGALLGRVRNHAAEVKSSQALAGDTNHG